MVTLTLSEFDAACKELHPKYYTFNSENQAGFLDDDYSVVNKFVDVSYMTSPNFLFFRGDSGDMQFNGVDCVECQPDFAKEGGEFEIVCSNKRHECGSARYKMWAEPINRVS